MPSDPNDFSQGDTDNNLLRKILNRLKNGITAVVGPITLVPEDIEIGAVELKDSDTDDRVNVVNVNPSAGLFGVVTRNIPSGTQAVSGDFLTDAQLRATPVVISGTVSVSSGPFLTDAQLRATPVVVSGPFLTDAQLRAAAIQVSGPLTDAELRAAPLEVNAALPAIDEVTQQINGQSQLRVTESDALNRIVEVLERVEEQLSFITDEATV